MLCGKIQLTLEIAQLQLDSNANKRQKRNAPRKGPKSLGPDGWWYLVLDGRITAGSLKQNPYIKSKNTAAIHGIGLILWRDEGWLTDSNPKPPGEKDRNLRSVPGAFSGMLLDEVRTARTVGMDRQQQLDTPTHTKRWSWWYWFKGWMISN